MTYRPHPQQQAIRALHDANGALTPALLVATARQPGHELHRLFDWERDDQAQLLTRARNLIRAQKILVTNRTGDHIVNEYIAVHSREDGLHYIASKLLPHSARRSMAEETL